MPKMTSRDFDPAIATSALANCFSLFESVRTKGNHNVFQPDNKKPLLS